METPNNYAGQLTEKVMAKVRNRFPSMPTHEYNGVYSAVYGALSAELQDAKEQPTREEWDTVAAVVSKFYNRKGL